MVHRDITRNAETALADGRPFRFDYEKSEQPTPYKSARNPKVYYKRPETSADIDPETGTSPLEDRIKSRKSRVAANVQVLAAFCVMARSAGRFVTPIGLLMSLVLSWIGNVSSAGASFLSTMCICLSRVEVSRIVDELASRYRRNVSPPPSIRRTFDLLWPQVIPRLIAMAASMYSTFLFSFDNYTYLQWGHHKKADEDFTRAADTLTLMVYAVPVSANAAHNPRTDIDRPRAHPDKLQSGRVQAFYDKYGAIFATASSPRRAAASVDIFCRDDFPFDESNPSRVASLKDITVLESLVAKSSMVQHLKDIAVVALNHYMEQANFPTDMFVVVDGEPALNFDVLTERHPELTSNIVVLLAIFHLQKHGLEDLFADPAYFDEITGPFLVTVMNYRAKYFQTILNQHREQQQHDDSDDLAADGTARALLHINPLAEDGPSDNEDGTLTHDVPFQDIAAIVSAPPVDLGQLTAALSAAHGDADDDVDDVEGGAVDDGDGQEAVGDVARAPTSSSSLQDVVVIESTPVASSVVSPDRSSEDRATPETVAASSPPPPPGADDTSAATQAAAPPRPSSDAAVKHLPQLGGSSVKSKRGMKINYGRLRFFMQLMFVAFCRIRSRIVADVVAIFCQHTNERGNVADFEDKAVEWFCTKSTRFKKRWSFFDNDLRMWIEPFQEWERGDSMPVYQHLASSCFTLKSAALAQVESSSVASLAPRRHSLASRAPARSRRSRGSHVQTRVRCLHRTPQFDLSKARADEHRDRATTHRACQLRRNAPLASPFVVPQDFWAQGARVEARVATRRRPHPLACLQANSRSRGRLDPQAVPKHHRRRSHRP